MKTYSYLKIHGILLTLQLFILLWELSFPTFTTNEITITQIAFISVHLLGNFLFNYLEGNGKIIEWKIWKSDDYDI